VSLGQRKVPACSISFVFSTRQINLKTLDEITIQQPTSANEAAVRESERISGGVEAPTRNQMDDYIGGGDAIGREHTNEQTMHVKILHLFQPNFLILRTLMFGEVRTGAFK
jgi:hypothetical protein